MLHGRDSLKDWRVSKYRLVKKEVVQRDGWEEAALVGVGHMGGLPK